MTGRSPLRGSGSRPTGGAAKASPAKPSIPNAKWQRGPFRTKVRGELGPEWWTVDGHNDGTFGLDRRRYLDDESCGFKFGYCVSHLPTGYAVRYVRAPLAKAKAFVSALHAASWDFTNPLDAKAEGRADVVKAACAVCETSTGAGFERASAIEARRAETAQTGSVADESAGPEDIAQPSGSPTPILPKKERPL